MVSWASAHLLVVLGFSIARGSVLFSLGELTHGGVGRVIDTGLNITISALITGALWGFAYVVTLAVLRRLEVERRVGAPRVGTLVAVGLWAIFVLLTTPIQADFIFRISEFVPWLIPFLLAAWFVERTGTRSSGEPVASA